MLNIEAISKKLSNRIIDNGINNVSIKSDMPKDRIKTIVKRGIRFETIDTLDKIIVACDELESEL